MKTRPPSSKRSVSLEISAPLPSAVAGLFVLAMLFGQPVAAQQTTGQQTSSLEEIIVTATKRSEAVRDISGSVTAITGDQLETLGAQNFADYLTTVPGVVLNAQTPGLSPVVIRGVSTTTGFDQGQATTGYFINDVPLTDPTFIIAIPDIDAFDVNNVTVLRGPQGTLFGSASLGGAINYQAATPNLKEYELHVQTTVDGVHGGGTGGAGKVMINVPIISDVLAVRGVYVYRNDAGFIDNIGTGQANANRTTIRGGRLEVTWKPSSTTTVNYLYLQQNEDTDDNNYTEASTSGPYGKNTLVAEPFGFTTTIHNLRLDQDLGVGTLTATGTFHRKSQSEYSDATPYGLLPSSANPVVSPQTGTGRGTTFEVRFASPSGQSLEYLVGVFHDDTRDIVNAEFQGANYASTVAGLQNFYGLTPGVATQITSANSAFEQDKTDFRGQESALFGEASYHLNSQWKVTLGGRAFDTKSVSHTDNFGLFELLGSNPPSPTQILSGEQEQHGFTPKGSITWTPTGDVMLYSLVSKGFRFGGPNILPQLPSSPEPRSYSSDSLINYEIGTRTTWLDRRLELDGTVYYIDWSNIQLREFNSLGAGFGVNAGKATNYGFEGTAAWRVVRGLTLQTNITYLEAQLAQTFVPGAGQPTIPKGATLPGASKWQVASSLIYQWLDAPLQPSLVLTQRYISGAPSEFDPPAQVTQGDYSLYDARTAIHFNNFSVTAFVENIGNTRGVTTAELFPPVPLQQFIVRPRTIGLTIDYKL
jgi:iron complex outermembrane recepter protein